MTLILQRPTGSKLTLRQTYIGTDDPDAAAYIAAVEAADEIASPGIGGLETATKVAIHDFVKGCKNDGIWPAIKASCILAGAKTLAGALVPLVKQPADSAPARFGTEGGWNYNRETGLQGNGTDNYINSGRANNADPQNNFSLSTYVTVLPTVGVSLAGALNGASGTSNLLLGLARCRTATGTSIATSLGGFVGVSRSSPNNYRARANSVNTIISQTSESPDSTIITLYSRAAVLISNPRIAFYSIGESLPDGLTKTGLQLLDERVSALITAFGVAIL